MINKRNVILNNYTMSKVIQQYFNYNTKKKRPGNPLGNRNKAQITLLGPFVTRPSGGANGQPGRLSAKPNFKEVWLRQN
jgi:hypothetical protein